MTGAREIACDESGYEGERLVGGETDVFAHAGVHLSPGAAAGCVTELRRRIRSPALEYKANHLLREKNRPVLVWLLGSAGPLRGHAHVHLVDKSFLLVRTASGQVVDDPLPAARAVHAMGRRAPAAWAQFLAAMNDRLRTSTRPGTPAGSPADLRDAIDALACGATGDAAAALGMLRAGSLRPAPELDPLGPAIARAAIVWSDGGRVPVSVVHHRQTALTGERISRITERVGAPTGPLIGLRFADSRTEPRVQVADFLAGCARKIASRALAGRADPELVALLAPYVDAGSVWGDDPSWAQLRPA